MTAEIVNLNKFRKAKERAEKEKLAQENRASFGRSKAERTRDEDEAERLEKQLDQAQRDTGVTTGATVDFEPKNPQNGNEPSPPPDFDPDFDPGTAS